MSAPRIITGGHVVLHVNGRPFGRVYQFSYRLLTGSEEITGIDEVEVIELATTTSRCMGTMEVWRTRGDGGFEGPGMSPLSVELPRGRYFNMQLIDRVTDLVLFEARWCRIEEQNWVHGVKQMSKGTATWKALTHSNEVKSRK